MMMMTMVVDEDEIEEISPIIQLFERVTFERGHEVHEQVSSMIDLFSSSDVTLDMLDTLIDCVKIVFIHQQTHKSTRILEFLITLAHVTHMHYTNNKNLSLVFDALIDLFSQTMIAMDSQIRLITLKILNKLQTFIDLSRSPYVSKQFEQNLFDLLVNENTLFVIDEVIPLAAKFQHRNPRFINAFLSRLTSPKWISSYLDRRQKILSLIEYSSSSLQYLLSLIENNHENLIEIAIESLLSDERGFTLETIGVQGRLVIFKLASQSRELSRLIFTRWIHQNHYDLIDILRLCDIITFDDKLSIEKTFEYFFKDVNIRQVVVTNLKNKIGDAKGGLLPSTVSSYIENLFVWRLLCQQSNEEEDDDDDDNLSIHPDFHELIAYFYRLVKSAIDEDLSPTKQFLICQYALILSTYDMLDTYRRKCLEATGRCILVHYGQYENIIKQAFHLINRIHSSPDTIHERYQLVTYTLNNIIQRCQTNQSEKIAFLQCMKITKVFIETEKHIDLNRRDFKQLIDSLIKSGLSHGEFDIQLQTLLTLHTLMCHSKEITIEYLKQTLLILNRIDDLKLKCQSLSTFLDVILIHGLEIFNNLNLPDSLTPTEFLTDLFSNFFDQENVEIKHLIVFGLMKLFLSSRLEPSIDLLKLILDYRFSNKHRFITEHQREQITVFFYFFTHQSISNVLLIENLTFEIVSHCLPFLSETSTTPYRSILIEPMCSFCIELLSLPTLPCDETNPESSHYHLTKNLLQLIENSPTNRTTFILKSYLNTIKHLQFQYMTHEQLESILDLIIQLRQSPNLPSIVENLIKNITDNIQSCLKLIHRLTKGTSDNKRPRSPSLSSQGNVTKRISLPFDPTITSSPNVLQDRTNQLLNTTDNRLLGSKGVKRKSRTQRYLTLDFENEDDDFF